VAQGWVSDPEIATGEQHVRRDLGWAMTVKLEGFKTGS